MSRAHALARRAWRTLRRWHLRARIAQLQALLQRPDLQTHPDYAARGLVAAHMAALQCELYVLELLP